MMHAKWWNDHTQALGTKLVLLWNLRRLKDDGIKLQHHLIPVVSDARDTNIKQGSDGKYKDKNAQFS